MIYNLAIHLLLPLSVLSTFIGFRGRGKLRALKTKFSRVAGKQLTGPVRFWLHGASMGEIQQVKIIRDWLLDLAVSEDQIVVTSQTFSGLENIEHTRKFVLPHDYPWLIKPLVKQLQPDWLIVVETELWPNLFRYNQGKVVIVNGKIKSSTYKNYRRLKPLLGSTIRHCKAVLARSDEDAERFREFSPRGTEITAVGSLKWLQLLHPPGELIDPPGFCGEPKILVAGSIHPGEEEQLIKLINQLDLVAYIAPRHLNRIDQLKDLLQDQQIEYCLWSEGIKNFSGQVIIVDRMGLLADLYRLGDLCFVGGSWKQQVGGHNLLEPVVAEKPVLTGPYLENVLEVAEQLERVGVLFKTRNSEEWFDRAREAVNIEKSTIQERVGKLQIKAKIIRDFYRSFLTELTECQR